MDEGHVMLEAGGGGSQKLRAPRTVGLHGNWEEAMDNHPSLNLRGLVALLTP